MIMGVTDEGTPTSVLWVDLPKGVYYWYTTVPVETETWHLTRRSLDVRLSKLAYSYREGEVLERWSGIDDPPRALPPIPQLDLLIMMESL